MTYDELHDEDLLIYLLISNEWRENLTLDVQTPPDGLFNFRNLGMDRKIIEADRGKIKAREWFIYDFDTDSIIHHNVVKERLEHRLVTGKNRPKAKKTTIEMRKKGGDMFAPPRIISRLYQDTEQISVYKSIKKLDIELVTEKVVSQLGSLAGGELAGQLQALILKLRLNITVDGELWDYDKLTNTYINDSENPFLVTISNLDLTQDLTTDTHLLEQTKILAKVDAATAQASIAANNALLSALFSIDHNNDADKLYQNGFSGNVKEFMLNELTMPVGE